MRIVFIMVMIAWHIVHAEHPVMNTAGGIQIQYEVFEDSKHIYDIEKILNHSDPETLFKPFAADSASYGFTKSRYWIKATLFNASSSTLQRLATFHYPLLDYVTMYEVDDKNKINRMQSGDAIPVSAHYEKNENIVFPVTLPPNTERILYFYIHSNSSMNIRLQILTMQEYYDARITRQVILSFLYGGSIIMILYNFFLFLSIRERSYFYYVLFQIANFLTLTSLSGMAFYYLWPEHPDMNNAIPSLIMLTNIMSVMFTRTFLETSVQMPKTDRFLQWLTGIFIIAVVTTLFTDYHTGIIIAVISIMATTFSLVTVGFVAYFKNIRASKFYLVAWIFLIIGATMTAFKNLGLFPINLVTTWGVQIGSLFEVVLLSLGLADRINTMRKEQNRLQQDAAQKAHALAEVLEHSKHQLVQTVKERTMELRETNIKLKENIDNKEALFRELHHRVKNNLQVIIAMLSLQKRRIHSVETKSLINDANKRLLSMSLVHEMLYQHDNIEFVDAQKYIHQLTQQLCMGFADQNIHVIYKLSPIRLDLDHAISLGLICNEIITNVFKHAFDDIMTGKSLYLFLKRHGDHIVFGIKDNGKGFDGDSSVSGHFGLTLIEDIVSKLSKGSFIFKSWNGTYFRMEFSL